MVTQAPFPQLGLAHFTVLEVPPLELAGLAADIGYASIGLRLIPAAPGMPAFSLRAGSAEVAALRHCLHDHGVRVHDVEIATITPEFEPASLAPVLEAAAEIGTARLSVCGDDHDRPRLVHRFGALCDLAAGYGIGVDLEWMGWRVVRTLADALSVVKQADRPNGGILVDALHLARNGGRPADLRTVPPGLIRSAQICDARAEAPVGTDEIIREARSGRLPPGEGVLPLADLLTSLPPDAHLSLEVPMGTALPPEARARRVYEAMAALLRHGRGE